MYDRAALSDGTRRSERKTRMEALNRIVENGRDCCAEPSPARGYPLAVRAMDEFEVASRPEMLSYVRARVCDFASGMRFPAPDVEDIRLAVGEAASNALRHGSTVHTCRIVVRSENHGDYLRVCVYDKGCGFSPGSGRVMEPADIYAEHGRGIMCMRAVMDEVRFRRTRPGTCVEMIKRIHPSRLS